jgi:hypothetical protein
MIAASKQARTFPAWSGDQLLRYADEDAELFRDPDGIAYATVKAGAHKETPHESGSPAGLIAHSHWLVYVVPHAGIRVQPNGLRDPFLYSESARVGVRRGGRTPEFRHGACSLRVVKGLARWACLDSNQGPLPYQSG